MVMTVFQETDTQCPLLLVAFGVDGRVTESHRQLRR